MELDFDPAKRDETLRLRRLDFAKSDQIFRGFHLSREDDREDYAETRVITLGRLGRTIVGCVWTERAGQRRIISLRRAEPDEREIFLYHQP